MYLFVFCDYGDRESFEVIGGYSNHYALQQFYEFVGGHAGISSTLFYNMIKDITFQSAVTAFNALCPSYKIKKVFAGLTEICIEDGDNNA